MTRDDRWMELFEEASEFEFGQLVRLLELQQGDREAVGRDADPRHEVVRFRPALTLRFPKSDVEALEDPSAWDDDDTEDEGRHVAGSEDRPQLRMVVTMLGLYGMRGELPKHYTQLLVERERARDPALREFFDIINHRFLSHLYRALDKYRYVSRYRATQVDPISQGVASLLGRVAEPGAAVDAESQSFLRYAGLFSQRPRSAASLEALLRDYLVTVPVEVVQFVGRWIQVPDSDQASLSDRGGTNALGRSTLSGERTWDVQGKFRIRIGPLNLDDYLTFQPGAVRFEAMIRLVREFAGDQLCFDVVGILHREEVPPARLGGLREGSVVLGRTCWLSTRGFTEDVEGPAFEVREAV